MWTSISDLKYLHVQSAFEAETLIFAVALIHLNQRIMVRCMRQSPLQIEHLISSCISPEYWGTFSVTVSTPNLDLKKITQMIQGIFFLHVIHLCMDVEAIRKWSQEEENNLSHPVIYAFSVLPIS